MDEEYCSLLEEYVNELVIALIIDMMKHGIFENRSDDIVVSKKFVEEAKEILDSIPKGDKYDKISRAVFKTLSSYYPEDMYEEEMVARANILLNYVGEILERHLDGEKL
ncbi:MAG: hypothetical protein J7L63_06275 [Thermoplasmata archaeon]|nr:hypothetical protein [Thermoplasmata archaeon]